MNILFQKTKRLYIYARQVCLRNTTIYMRHITSCLRALDYAVECIVSDLVFDGLTRGPFCLDAIYMVYFVDCLDDVLVRLRDHGMRECPAGAAGEFGDDDVAVAEEVDVEVDVVDWLDRN
jgi:hypothetical protein